MIALFTTGMVAYAQQIDPNQDPNPLPGFTELGWFVDTPHSGAGIPFEITWFNGLGVAVAPTDSRNLIDPFNGGVNEGRARAGSIDYPVASSTLEPFSLEVKLPPGWVIDTDGVSRHKSLCYINPAFPNGDLISGAQQSAFQNAIVITPHPSGGGAIFSNIVATDGVQVGCYGAFVHITIAPDPDVDDGLDDVEAEMKGKETQITNLQVKVDTFDQQITDLQIQIDDENTKQQKLQALNTQVSALTQALNNILLQLALL